MSKRSKRKSFKAITGERLEYRVPGSVMDALGNRGAMAACYRTTDDFMRVLDYAARTQERRVKVAQRGKEMYGPPVVATPVPALPSHLGPLFDLPAMTAPPRANERQVAAGKRYERKGKLAASKAGNVAEVQALLRKEEARLRDLGVKGAIPVCVGRTTGKKAGTERFERRSTAIHERFHADVRRYEARKGLQPGVLDARMLKMLETEFGEVGRQAVALSNINKWSRTNRAAAEEVLARVEEIRKSCVRSKADCDAIKNQFHTREQRISGKYRVGGELMRFDHTMERLTDAIRSKYSGALAFVGAAHRGLLAQDFRGFRGLPAHGRIPMAQVQRAMKMLGRKVQKCRITPAALREGMEVEREHRDVSHLAVGVTAKIAASHLCERRDYYKRIKRFVEPRRK